MVLGGGRACAARSGSVCMAAAVPLGLRALGSVARGPGAQALASSPSTLERPLSPSTCTHSHAIVSSATGPEYYVAIYSFVDKTQLEPGCSVLLHNKVRPMLWAGVRALPFPLRTCTWDACDTSAHRPVLHALLQVNSVVGILADEADPMVSVMKVIVGFKGLQSLPSPRSAPRTKGHDVQHHAPPPSPLVTVYSSGHSDGVWARGTHPLAASPVV